MLLLLVPVAALARVLFRCARQSEPGSARCLVIRTDRQLGEVLLTTPLMRALAREYGPVDVLIHSRQAEWLAEAPFVRRVFPLDKGLRRLSLSLRQLMSVPLGYDLVVDAGHRHEATSSMWVAYVLGGMRRLGHRRGPHAFYYSTSCPVGAEDMHEIDRKLELLSPLRIQARDRQMWAPTQWCGSRSCEKRAVLYLGTRRSGHRLPHALWRRITRLCIAQGYSISLAVGRDERPDFEAESDLRSAGYCAARYQTVAALAGLFERAGVVIVGNTGPMHLAVAMGVPTIGIFAAGSVRRWGHDMFPHSVVHADDSRLDAFEAALARLGTTGAMR